MLSANLQPVFDAVWRDGLSDALNAICLGTRVHGTRQHHATPVGDNHDILCPERERVVLNNGLANSASGFEVVRRLRLIEWRDAGLELDR